LDQRLLVGQKKKKRERQVSNLSINMKEAQSEDE
jgi:hypothetical protein